MTTSPASPHPLPPFLARAHADGLLGADAAEDCLRAHRELLAIGQELTLDDIAEIKGYLTAEQTEAVKQALFAASSAPRFLATAPVIATPEDPGIAAGAFGDATDTRNFFPPRPAAAEAKPEAQPEGGRRVVACSRCRAKIATQRPDGSLTVCPRCGGAFVIGGGAVEALVVRKESATDAPDEPRRVVECPACGLQVSTARPSWALEPCPGCGHDDPPAGGKAAAPAPQAAPEAIAPPPPPPAPAAPQPAGEPAGAASETLRRGSIIGPYHIESQLGRRPGGGVYVAIGPGGARVRLKVLGPEPDPLARASFLRQAAFLIRSLEKRPAGGLLRPTARGEAGDLLWVATELVAGKTLAERIAEGPVPEAEAARLACTIAQRLSELHEGGMVHRRLKPSNVVLEGGADVALADAGIGLLRADAVDEEAGRFRAPELAQGQTGASDRRADLFALGAVFFDMIGGKLSSPALAVVIGALLDHNPAGRPASAAEVVRSIERTTKPRGEPGARPSPDPGAPAHAGHGSARERVSAEVRLASAARRGWLAGAVVGGLAAVAATLVLVALLRGGFDGGDLGPSVGDDGGTVKNGVVAPPPLATGPSAPGAGSKSGGKAPTEEHAPPAHATATPPPKAVLPPDDALGDALLRVRAAVTAGDIDEAERALAIAKQLAPLGDPRCAAAGAVIEQTAKSLRASLEASVTAWLVRRESLGCPSCRFVREVACRACKGTGRDVASLSGRCPTCGGCGRTPCAAPGCVRGFDRAALRAVAFDPLSDAARRAIEIDGVDFYVEGIAAGSLGEPASSVLARAAYEREPAALRPIARLDRIDYEVLGGDVKVRAKVSYRGGAAVVEETHWRRDGGAWRLDLGLDADARGGGR